MRTFFLTIMLMTAIAPAVAENYGPVETVNVTGFGHLTYQELFTVVGEEGQSMDEVAKMAAPRLRAFSDATGYEACGVFASDGKRFGVVIGSNHSHLACANFPSIVPAGMTAVKGAITIHSHGKDNISKPNNNDRVLAGNFLDAHGLGRNTGKMINILGGQQVDEFSDRDFDGGAGYLAIPNGLIFQEGKKKVRIID